MRTSVGLLLGVATALVLAAGCTGPAGSEGAVGPAGPAGPPGQQGSSGPVGPRGDAGHQGDAGPAGQIGDSGPAGLKGDIGSPGRTGDAGPPGPAGPAPSAADVEAAVQLVLRGVPADVDSIARGGKLYDKWWTEADVAEPAGDHPLWALQTTNTAAGSTTWRCKECHGWDYKGVGGAYSSGSHRTNFPGVYRAGATMSRTQLLDVMQGAFDYRHDFSTVMPAGDLTDLVNFLSEGLVNVTAYLDYAAAAPRQADLATGEQLYVNTCAECHGDDGKRVNFGDAASPEYVGTVARANPWETLHKIRVGQPATGMPSAIVSGWSAEDVLDVLGYAQTLPGAPAPAPSPVPLAEITYEATWPAWYLTQAKRVYQNGCSACHDLPTVESIKAFASDADTVDMAVAMAEGAALNEEDAARVVRYLLALRHDTAP